MKTHGPSRFKNEEESFQFITDWVAQLSKTNHREYIKNELSTSLGKTVVWELKKNVDFKETIVIFPGYRTSALFWDLDKGLDVLKNTRIYLVEINGQANLSDGYTPDIKSLDYGHWATEVLDQLKIGQTHIAGASFGALICMKLCIVSPDRIRSAVLLNPACFRLLSLSLPNLYYNLLPILRTNRNNVTKFLNHIVFCKPYHAISKEAELLIIDYEVHAMKNHIDKNQKPYPMKGEVGKHNVSTHLVFGEKDIFMPYKKSLKNAKANLSNLQSVTIFKNVGHGIETYRGALEKIYEIMSEENDVKDLKSKT